MSWISWMLWVMRFFFLCFEFSLVVVSISSAPDILFSIHCIQLVNLTFVILDLFPRFSISRFASIYVLFIVSTSTFRSWTALSNSFTYLVVFSYISLKDLFVSSLRASTCLPVSSCIYFSELFISSLKDSIIFMR